MHPLSDEAKRRKIDENPFADLKVSDYSFLDSIQERTNCSKCEKSRKYFCYICYLPVKQLEGRIPQLQLPIKIDIIKHKNEIDGKSTSSHAAIIAPNDVRVFTFPCVPEYDPDEGVILIYPGKGAKSVKEYFEANKGVVKSNGMPFSRAVFIDSTWKQSKRIFNDERLQNLPKVILKNKISQFWRHQKNSPRWYLATIEAIHELLREIECEMGKTYDGKYDDLLFFFCFMYSKIHTYYDHETLLSYKRPLE
ncbi:UNVERIFIED_CONTAM: hypothetical protein PYX00_006119 [Menopon gallinae]|uniref:tRNA-uridine aminocarboxypropyltransferase 1 n=1 Tax=Menopon gallinae TaxID=328185 RepID=A0AAW2HV45_9NEOP